MEALKEKIFTALGSASMCWSETPMGVFDSNNCLEIGNKLIEDIKQYIKENNDKTI